MIPERINYMQGGMVTNKLINMQYWSQLWIHNTLIELSKCESKKKWIKILNNSNEWNRRGIIGDEVVQDPCIILSLGRNIYLDFLDLVSVHVNVLRVRNEWIK